MTNCPACNGRGRRAVSLDPVLGPEIMAVCTRCAGSGEATRRDRIVVRAMNRADGAATGEGCP